MFSYKKFHICNKILNTIETTYLHSDVHLAILDLTAELISGKEFCSFSPNLSSNLVLAFVTELMVMSLHLCLSMQAVSLGPAL